MRKINIKKINIQRKNLHWQIPLTLAMFILSFLITAQFRKSDTPPPLLNNQSFENLSTLMVSLSEKRDALFSEYDDLSTEYTEMELAQNGGKSMLSSLIRQKNNLSLIAGTVGAKGSGIIITIPKNNKMMYYDLIDIINELYLSGASIISINDIRIGIYSNFSEKYDVLGNNILTLNDAVLAYPLTICALGESDTLEKGLTYTGGIISNLNLLYSIYPEIKHQDNILIRKADKGEKL